MKLVMNLLDLKAQLNLCRQRDTFEHNYAFGKLYY
jgi:hypothetical protein